MTMSLKKQSDGSGYGCSKMDCMQSLKVAWKTLSMGITRLRFVTIIGIVTVPELHGDPMQ